MITDLDLTIDYVRLLDKIISKYQGAIFTDDSLELGPKHHYKLRSRSAANLLFEVISSPQKSDIGRNLTKSLVEFLSSSSLVSMPETIEQTTKTPVQTASVYNHPDLVSPQNSRR